MCEFGLKELELLHAKMAVAVSEVQKIELYSILAPAIFYAWYVSIVGKAGAYLDLVEKTLWIPPVFILLAGLRMAMQRSYIRAAAEYTRKIEDHLAASCSCQASNTGWENYCASQGQGGWTLLFRVVFWLGLLGITIWIGLDAHEIL
ncbi:hypothetical protein [Leisingera aquaemixtae]|uniref:hypothetical protein n=1 Tax=Leisingera aquaemixtae TaxID=1396826 RepID=UPI0011AEA967|nr:hypothetical protein [Leisingera aquaemixtae]